MNLLQAAGSCEETAERSRMLPVWTSQDGEEDELGGDTHWDPCFLVVAAVLASYRTVPVKDGSMG